MTTTDDSDNGWDSLAEDLGIQPAEPAARSEKAAPKPEPAGRAPAAGRPAHRDTRPEPEDEAEDFGAGVTAEPARSEPAYDPGADGETEFSDDEEDGPEPPDEDYPHEAEGPAAEGEGPPGGKKRRRRRRRRKKGGGPDGGEGAEAPEAAGANGGEEADGSALVEEGEAPAEVEDLDDESSGPTSAVDEEMEAEVAQPRPEWRVMTWAELVSKLYRPG